MTRLSLENGNVVEIKGKDKVYAIAWPGNPEDPKDIIRIDGNTRANLGVGIDKKIQVSRAEARPARKIVVAPRVRSGSWVGHSICCVCWKEGRL